jgi:16S rRNA G966 N2-methylase RsmD
VNTKGSVTRKDLGLSSYESHDYSSVFYKHIFDMLNKLPIEKNKSTVLDYGCGKGRVLITAASNQYKRIIGIEISGLLDVASNNINKMQHRKTSNIELKQCDAVEFSVPSDVNIIYFYNPFEGSMLENVINNIHSSYMNTPRTIYIIYFNNDHFDKIITHRDWIVKSDQCRVYPNISCGLYETNI